MNELLDHALKYAAYGWHIFPCKLDKTPHTENGFKAATTHEKQIREWWSRWPDASIGCATGPGSKIWVLDIDLPDGPANLESVCNQHDPLPATMRQQTGSGGYQYFFQWNGHDIRNTAGRIAPSIDTRGFGGYIILPPSPHPSGKTYQWLEKHKPVIAPKWLSQMAVKKESIIKRVSHTNSESVYGEKALAGELIELSRAGEGTRNDRLNIAALKIGGLVAGGELDEGHVINSLLGVALSIGLSESEARATIKSGMEKGFKTPRSAPENNKDIEYTLDIENFNESSGYSQSEKSVSVVSVVSNGSDCKQVVSKNEDFVSKGAKVVSNGPDFVSTCKQDESKTPQNLMGHIREFIKNSKGCFTTKDIDIEFGLQTRKEKNARSRALNYMVSINIINKDRAIAGKYHILDSSIEWIDLDAPAEERFPIILPFDLHYHVVIPPKAIIVIAGSTNAGKTAFILNTLKLNRHQPYKKMYLMSEMGTGEYVSRIRSFGEPMDNWKCINAASKSYDFNGAILHHNPNGLTCIDFLEDVGGEYFKIASGIRDVYDSLSDGVAVVAIQKDTKKTVARGGEATMEKARLYITLDYICSREHSIICAVQVTKLKNYTDKNLQGHELHFELTRGTQMSVVMDWKPSSQVDRDKCRMEYERGARLANTDNDSIPPVYFKKWGDKKDFRVTEDTIVKWALNFPDIDVYEEVKRVAESHNKKPFIRGFNHLVNYLASINKSYSAA